MYPRTLKAKSLAKLRLVILVPHYTSCVNITRTAINLLPKSRLGGDTPRKVLRGMSPVDLHDYALLNTGT